MENSLTRKTEDTVEVAGVTLRIIREITVHCTQGNLWGQARCWVELPAEDEPPFSSAPPSPLR